MTNIIDLKGNPFYLTDEDIKWVEKTKSSLSVEEKIGQLFCVMGTINETAASLDHVLKHFSPGGIMFRPMSIKDAVSFKKQLDKDLKIPPLIAANLERGGNGILEEGTYFSSHLQAAAAGKDAIRMAHNLGIVSAREGLAVGANWSFAPIIDIDYNYRNPITNTRTFGSNPERVKQMGKAYVEAVQQLGVAATIKHFPGDGCDDRDQHLVTTINDLDCKTWDETFGAAYQTSIDAGAMSVMIGHILLPSYQKHFKPELKDEELLPASLSKELMINLLREKLKFNGLIVTDATTMAGFLIPLPRSLSVPLSIENGNDMFLFTRHVEEDYQFMLQGYREGVLSEKRLNDAVTRILATKASLKLHIDRRDVNLEKAYQIVGSETHHDLAKECADLSITLVKEEKGVLPITTKKYKKILYYPIESELGVAYSVKAGVANRVKELLMEKGFEVETFVPYQGLEGSMTTFKSVVEKYDLIIYLANMSTKSNQTTVRIEWQQPMGANVPIFINSIPTIFISVENPYHLQDVPRVKTFINTYSSHDEVLEALIDKLMGVSVFKGENPIDPFCGRWDTKL